MSPFNHRVVGEYIRNPTLRLLPLEFPTFPQAISKERKRTKKKENHRHGPLLSSKLPHRKSNYKGNGAVSPWQPARFVYFAPASQPEGTVLQNE
jgi:hypothetical protein